ncbi:bifunctional riboflavin kinase/FAD synthetase [Clostridium sp. BJN0001]|uniref:bifunctional riboflavin kinase/FAD synthetase n=1 Tax=Clostridium sp. BJN0001 TaxID=2930219 RepID=UPI001FD5F048|nr:bifunctional riboflavin kinase/FAD synthetase [Clostridium sp. BJN0001]
MIVIEDGLKKDMPKDNYVALGSFDGLHTGHISLISEAVAMAKKYSGNSMVFTFKNHPKTLLMDNFNEELLMSNKRKKEILEDHNVDSIVLKTFDYKFMKITAEDFIKNLVFNYNAKGIVAGFNYRFGYMNEGNIETLKKYQAKYGYKLFILEPCIYKDGVISSTRIRKELKKGNVQDAFKMLDRPYELEGKVVCGRQIGRTIGFPTANLSTDKKYVIPLNGVYYSNVRVNNKIYRGITNVGNNPTVNGEKRTVETHILDFDENIYGIEMNLYFIDKIRDEKKFSGIDDLKRQIEKDKNFAIKQKIVIN